MSVAGTQGLRGFAKRKVDSLREYGVARTIYSSLIHQFDRVGFALFEVQIGDDRLELEDPVLEEGYHLRMQEPQDLLPWADSDEAAFYDLSRAHLLEAQANGDRCVVNYYHDDLVGFGFVTPTRARITDQVDVVIESRLVYRYKGWTHPDHRRKKLSFARGRANRRLFPLVDGRRTVSIVSPNNYPSKLHSSRLHPIKIGWCGYVTIRGKQYPFTSRRAQRFGFKLDRHNPVGSD